MIWGRNCIYFTWVAASYRGEARVLSINASPRERSLVKFHLSEFQIWKGFSHWGNRGSVACHLLLMKTSATYPQSQGASQHLDWYMNKAPQSLAHCHACVVWWAATHREPLVARKTYPNFLSQSLAHCHACVVWWATMHREPLVARKRTQIFSRKNLQTFHGKRPKEPPYRTTRQNND